VYQFWRHRTTVNPMRPDQTSSLVTSGIYRISRNPIYLADLVILVAWMVWLGAWINIIWLAAFVVYISRFQILPEERMLAGKFGEEWDSYCARVRRWI
jgi:protein-S-isoprenylcysteine O-methyltransferase Ste14